MSTTDDRDTLRSIKYFFCKNIFETLHWLAESFLQLRLLFSDVKIFLHALSIRKKSTFTRVIFSIRINLLPVGLDEGSCFQKMFIIELAREGSMHLVNSAYFTTADSTQLESHLSE